ncbi:hypothetical protein [Sporosarcina sp. P20a]|nr:hypothetical protein [Sporosarcina sp. P20a]
MIGLTNAHDFRTWAGTMVLIIASNYLMITSTHVLPAVAQINGFQPLFRY